MTTSFEIIIPARFASKRLPGKPLRDICGKPLIQRVYECAIQSSADSVTVATDDDGILRVAQEFGANVCLTKGDHLSGTDRLAEAAETLGLDDDRVVVNLQGDEPRVPGVLIDQVAACLVRTPEAVMATACQPLERTDEYEDQDVVKVVRDRDGFALYFSRSPIPWSRVTGLPDSGGVSWSIVRRHIGIYAYQVRHLRAFSRQGIAPLEKSERLEQLRALWNGDRIAVCDALEMPGPGVDTLADLETAIRYFS